MSQETFGEVLRNTREVKGIDINDAAQSLRIRPDILRAIENSDYASMPPRGYARNMIHAYARLLGLDPNDVTRMYLSGFHSYQVRSQHETTRSERSASRTLQNASYTDNSSTTTPSSGSSDDASSRSRFSSSRFNRSSQSRSSSEPEIFTDTRYGGSSVSQLSSLGSSIGEKFSRLQGVSARANSTAQTFSRSNTATGVSLPPAFLLIGAGIIIVLLIILGVLIFGNATTSSSGEVPSIPVSGLTDPQSDVSSSTSSETISSSADIGSPTYKESSVSAPESVDITYKISSDAGEIYVVITADGVATEQMMEGPITDTVEISSGTWSFSTWLYEEVSITVEGEKVDFTVDGSSIPTYTFDFDKYLDEWYEDHGISASDSKSSSQTTSKRSSDDSDDADDDSLSENDSDSSSKVTASSSRTSSSDSSEDSD